MKKTILTTVLLTTVFAVVILAFASCARGVNTPTTADGFIDRGISLATRSEFDAAVLDFTQAIELDPNLAAAYRLRGRALFASVSLVADMAADFSWVTATIIHGTQATQEQLDVLARAIADFTQAVSLDPNDSASYVERGRIHFALGDIDQTIADYTQAIRVDPNNALAFHSRGVTHSMRGNLNQAIADLNEAIRIDPNHALAFNGRGHAHSDMGNFDQAIADFSQALRLNPNFVSALIGRGFAHWNRGDLNSVIADFEALLRIDPNNADAREWLEEARRQRGR